MGIALNEFAAMQDRLNSAKRKKLNPPPPDACEREKDLHAQIVAYCKSKGWLVFHGSMAHRAMRTLGEPDVTILADAGRVLFCEMKTRTGKLSVEQNALHHWAAKLGHKVHVVRSFTEFLAIL